MNRSQREVDVIFVDQTPQPVVDPLTVLERWLGEAKNQIGFQASAMSLATITQTGQPDVRVVLLQSIRDAGLVFFTNMKSLKSEQMMATSKAAACFYWATMGRQVRV